MKKQKQNDNWYDRLRARMKERGVTAADLARNTSLSEGAISQWLSGTVQHPKYESLRPVCNYLRTSADWILYADPVTVVSLPGATYNKQPFSATPVTHTVKVSVDGTWQPSTEREWRMKATVQSPTGEQGWAVEIRGDAYAPTLRDGWFLTIDPEAELVPGEFVRVELADGARMIAELLFERRDSVGLMKVNSTERMTYQRSEIASILPVTGIIPPSMLRTG